jgi:2-alkyl-3-oxoalkanoate reductase
LGGAQIGELAVTALVTGAAGFLGRYIVEKLRDRGDEVRALCRAPTPQLEAAGAEVRHGDVREPATLDEAMSGVNTVYHVAGVAGVWGPWKHFYTNNTLGTENVIAACKRNNVQRLVYTSSPSVAFDLSDQCGVPETAPYATRWLCHYPQSKALAEQAVLRANGENGLHTCALRPHLIWGPRDRQLLPRLLAQARKGKLWRVGDGSNEIDIVYVENAAAAHIQAANALTPGSPVCGKAYFISQGEPVKCWQWIGELLSMAGIPPVKKSLSLRAAWQIGAAWETAYRVFGVRNQPPMTRFLASQLGRSHWFDISAARRDFGYEPSVSTPDGMQRLKRWLVTLPVLQTDDSLLASETCVR